MVNRRYLIVGGTGYFGSRLAEALTDEACVVVTQRSIAPERTSWIKRTNGLEAVEFDSAVSSQITVSGEFDAIINLAMPGAAEAARDPEAGRERALATAKACLELVETGRAKRLIQFISFHVYGVGNRDRYDECDQTCPTTPYSRIHSEVEQYVLRNSQVIAVRPTNMIGAPAHAALGDQRKLLFLDLCRQASLGKIQLNNDGFSYRDFLPFRDAIEAVRMLLTTDRPHYQLFNLARGEAMRLDSAANMIRDVAGNEACIQFGSGQDAYRQPFVVNTNRLRELGWKPRTSLRDEAKKIVGFFKNHN